METHSDVELILAAELDQVFVAANATGFQCLRAQLFIFIGHEMDAQWKIFDESLLAAQVKDANLWVWHTTAETRLWVRLVLTVSITAN